MRSIPRLITDSGDGMAAPMLIITPTDGTHIAALKKNLRPADATEILRFGVTIQHALWYSYKHSLIRKTALVNGVVAACWGICGNFMGGVGRPWLMTTPEVRKVSPLRFARLYQQEVLQMLKMFPKLENYVDAEYTTAIRLLEIVDFQIGEPEIIRGALVRKFVRVI